MNLRQQKFCTEFLKSGSAAGAARAAGYAEGSAAQQGQRLLRNANVRQEIGDKLKQIEGQGVADVQECMMFLSSVMRGEIKDAFGLDCSIADRIVAAKELLKRLDAGDGRRGTLERLDRLLFEFRLAVCGLDSDDEDEDDMPTD